MTNNESNEDRLSNAVCDAASVESSPAVDDTSASAKQSFSEDAGACAAGSGNETSGSGSASTDLFADLGSLRLEQDFVAELGLVKPLGTVPVRKPGKTSFIRVHPDKAFRFQTAVIELKDEGETYLVAKELWPHLVNESAFVPKVLVTYMSRPGDVLALWPIRLPGPDGRLDDYNRSALNIGIELATKSWVRVNANRDLGAYEATVAPAGMSWGEPKWPDMPFPEILRLAFKDKVIESLDHPVLKRLRGEE